MTDGSVKIKSEITTDNQNKGKTATERAKSQNK